jgi:hypothetical protein
MTESASERLRLPVLPLKETVVFPESMTPLAVGQERSVKLIDDVLSGERMLALFTVRHTDAEPPGWDDLYTVGTVAVVHKMIKVPDGTLRILVQGLQRVRLVEPLEQEPDHTLRDVDPVVVEPPQHGVAVVGLDGVDEGAQCEHGARSVVAGGGDPVDPRSERRPVTDDGVTRPYVVEGQIGGSDLEHAVVGPEPVHREADRGPGHEDDRQSGRRGPHERLHESHGSRVVVDERELVDDERHRSVQVHGELVTDQGAELLGTAVRVVVGDGTGRRPHRGREPSGEGGDAGA